MSELTPYLTVKEVAGRLGITDDGVRKLIRAGKVRAVKRSERKTLIPRPAFDAYQRKLNGESGQPIGLQSAVGSLAERTATFEQDAGMSPEDWRNLQISDDDATHDDAEGMRLTVSALGLIAERRRAEGFVEVPVRPVADHEQLRNSSRVLLPLGPGG
jgi:excisionase family DNA binding protein